jgi:hypothetical protein
VPITSSTNSQNWRAAEEEGGAEAGSRVSGSLETSNSVTWGREAPAAALPRPRAGTRRARRARVAQARAEARAAWGALQRRPEAAVQRAEATALEKALFQTGWVGFG